MVLLGCRLCRTDHIFQEEACSTVVRTPSGKVVMVGGYINGFYYKRTPEIWRSDDGCSSWVCVTSNANSMYIGETAEIGGVSMPDNSIVLVGAGQDDDVYKYVLTTLDYASTWIYNANLFDWGVTASFGFVLVNVTVGGSSTSNYAVFTANSGDIYNIGGVSSEPTNNILITAWDNDLY